MPGQTKTLTRTVIPRNLLNPLPVVMKISSFFSRLAGYILPGKRASTPPFAPVLSQDQSAYSKILQHLPKELHTQFKICINSTETGFWEAAISSTYTLDPNSRIQLSPIALRLMGYPPGSSTSLTISQWFEQIHSKDLPEVENTLNDYLRQKESTRQELIIEFRLKQDKVRWLRLVISLFTKKKHRCYLGGVIRDITKARLIYDELEHQLAFQRELLEILPNPVFIKNKKARFVAFNLAYEKAFGISREKFIGKSVMELEFLPLKERIAYQKEDTYLIKTASTSCYETDFTFSDDKIHHCLYWSKGFYNKEKNLGGLIGLIVDITEQKETERNMAQKIKQLNADKIRIERMSRVDSLTGLVNRREFMEQLQRNITQANRYTNTMFSLIMIDLDDFKIINDTYGHATGDKVLQKFAKDIKQICRKGDTAARVGGEEFFIILPMTAKKGALAIAERIRKTIKNNQIPPSFTASIGVVEHNKQEDASQLLKRVDKAMYDAKDAGKDRVNFLAETDFETT